MYKFLDHAGVEYLIDEIKDRFVQQESGKGLSANDFTTILKQKLDGIATGAQVNKVDSVNGKEGKVVITSEDIDFLSSVSGSSAVTIRKIIDDILAKDKAQDVETGKKADKSDTYTKAQVDGKITPKADTTYVNTGLDKKVDKITGKSLSANDFTTVLKNKLDGVEVGAKDNIIEVIKRNGSNLTVTSRAVDISVPTKISDLTNDKTYKTEAEIKTMIQDLGKMKREIVTVLPAVEDADDNTMYLVASTSESGYSEWLLINEKFEKLGDTGAIDLTGYVKKSDITTVSNVEIDAFFNA